MHSTLLLMYLGLVYPFWGMLKFLASYQAAWVQTMSSVLLPGPSHCCVGLEACISGFLGDASSAWLCWHQCPLVWRPGLRLHLSRVLTAVPGLCHAAVCPPWDSQEPPPLSPTPRAWTGCPRQSTETEGEATVPGLLFLFAAPNRDLPTFIFRFLGNCFAFYPKFLL